MSSVSFSTTIVIPAFNEERRLPKTLLTLFDQIKLKALEPVRIEEVLVVDDGSSDGTVALVKELSFRYPILKIVESGANFGKGHAVRLGFQNATCDWVLMADADMATPWTEAVHLAREVIRQDADIAIGSRDLKESEVLIKQSWLRENLGKTFNRFVKLMTGLPFQDTQCGFKFFNRKKIEPWLPLLRVNDFAWDVEFLLRAQQHSLRTIEVPVVWRHIEGSRISPLFDGIKMGLTVLWLRIEPWIKNN